MESVHREGSDMNQRRSLGVLNNSSHNNCGQYGSGFVFNIPYKSANPSLDSLSNLFLTMDASSLGLYGSSRQLPPCLPPQNYSSLQQPPILPLPFSKSFTIPPPTKRMTHNKKKVQRKPWNQKPIEKAVALLQKENKLELKEEDDFDMPHSLYSISPPPSSLPLPRFSLMRPKAVASTASSVDAGATDDLRRLLRL